MLKTKPFLSLLTVEFMCKLDLWAKFRWLYNSTALSAIDDNYFCLTQPALAESYQ